MARHSRSGGPIGRRPILVGVLVLSVGAASAGAVRVLSADSSSAPACTAPLGTLTVGAAPATAPWLRSLAASYTGEHRTVAGRCVQVAVETLTQDQAKQALRPVPFPGAPTPPDVWIPESTTSVALLRATPDGGTVLAGPTPSIASSPAVLAAPADALRLLAGPTGNQPPLSLLSARMADRRGWGQPGLGHPEWGPIKVTTTDPGSTPLGTGMLLALVGVQTQTPTPQVGAAQFLRPDVQQSLLGLARTLRASATTGDQLMAEVTKAGTVAQAVSSLGVIAAYEQDVWKYDRDGPAIVLSVAYPADGQLAADYPYVVPKGSWVDAADRAAAADFRGWLLSPAVQSRLDQYGLRGADGVGGKEIAAGLRVPSLLPLAPVPQQAIDGPAAARRAWRLLTRRVSLLGLFDVSGSMADPVPGSGQSKLDVARAAAQAALGFFDPADSIGLWEFSRQLDGDRDYRVLVPLGPAGQPVGPFPNRQVASVAAYRQMAPRTATGLYDSILAAYRSAIAAYRPDAVNSVVVITDGKNEDPGSITLGQLLAKLRALHDPARPVHVVTLAYGTGADQAALAQVAKATDGLQFASPDPRSIGKVFVTAVGALTG